MTGQKTRFSTYEANYLGEYNQRELDDYRNVGTIVEFRHLKYQEIRRKQRIRKFLKSLDTLIAAAALTFITELIFFFVILYR